MSHDSVWTNFQKTWWQQATPALLAALDSSAAGLASTDAAARLLRHGPNRLQREREAPVLRRLLARLANPLVAMLLLASLVSAVLGDRASFGFVAVIVLLSIALDFVQEHRAGRAVQALQASVALRARVLRDGLVAELAVSELVPGDVLQLSPGSLVPADGRLLQAKALFVNAAALTGEAYPTEKTAAVEPEPSDDAASSAHAVCAGCSVVSGAGLLLVCATGRATALGQIAHSLAAEPPATAFERGMRGFGLLLTRLTLALVLFVMLVNVLAQRPLLDAFMFAVALAVGLTPELLPMIVSVTLARGALRMAAQQVIVKRLSAIEDLGAMDILCTDKTGTLTEARIRLEQALGPSGEDCPQALALAALNAHFESGLRSPLDDAILAHPQAALTLQDPAWRKLDELPFDFERRRVSVLLQRDAGGAPCLIVKGAPEDLLRLCSQLPDGAALDATARAALLARVDALGAPGLRVLAVAQREGRADVALSLADESELVFVGLLAFLDPPKRSAAAALHELKARGVSTRIVTGDSEAVTRHLATELGLPVRGVLSGHEIARLDDHGLRAAVAKATLFCRVNPEQKNRVVRAFKARGHVVGYLGDGINDAPPLHSADVGISVDGGVDVAKQAADLVLLKPDLDVLRLGVLEGRRTFVNVMKYIMMASSSNFGNMLSMAAASLFVPFLPMLPVQILLNNFLYDLSEIPLPLDEVDAQDLRAPKRWEVRFVRNFMLCFGALSSVFDFLTFALLIAVLKAGEALFQTAWFVESMATQVLVVFIIRTRNLPWRSRPAPALQVTALAVLGLAFALPYTGLGARLGFVPLPPWFLAAVLGMTAVYLVAAELLKRAFYRWTQSRHG